MNDEKWEQIVTLAKQNFQRVSLHTEDLIVSTPDGDQVQGTQDILEFDKSGETFKLIRENRPVVLEKKMHYSHRAGDTARAEYVHSETEFSHRLVVLKETNDGDWEEVTAGDLGL